MRRRFIGGGRKLQFFTKRFYPAGNYTWIVPAGCTQVDVFLVGGGGGAGNGGSDGGDGDVGNWIDDTAGLGQGHTTRDFGESGGKRNAGGGCGQIGNYLPGASDYKEGKGLDGEGGEYAGKGGGGYGGDGGDGTVLIRYWAYEE